MIFITGNERIIAYSLKTPDGILSGPPDFLGLSEFKQFQTSSSDTVRTFEMESLFGSVICNG